VAAFIACGLSAWYFAIEHRTSGQHDCAGSERLIGRRKQKSHSADAYKVTWRIEWAERETLQVKALCSVLFTEKCLALLEGFVPYAYFLNGKKMLRRPSPTGMREMFLMLIKTIERHKSLISKRNVSLGEGSDNFSA
jgi:hypothetical protein